MTGKWVLTASLLAMLPAAAHAAGAVPSVETVQPRAAIPAQLDAEQRAGYRAVFASIRAERRQDAQLALAS